MKQEYMTHDMKKTLTRLFTVALLMMVSLGRMKTQVMMLLMLMVAGVEEMLGQISV